VNASFEDIAKGIGCSTKTVQRALEELEAGGYVEVERATSQYGLTQIEITNYDPPNSAEGADTSVHTSASSELSTQDLQAPKKLRSKEYKKGTADAVRRPVDAEHHFISRKGFPPLKKRENLTARLAEKIRKNCNGLDRKLDENEQKAFLYIRYTHAKGEKRYLNCERRHLSGGFVCVVGDIYETHKAHLPLPGNFCSKVIDRCVSEQEACRSMGMDPSEYFWPPDFQEHRDRLRKEEASAVA
jgi:hypothetical protein